MDCLFPKMRIEYVIDWYKRSKNCFLSDFYLTGYAVYRIKRRKEYAKKRIKKRRACVLRGR